MKLSKSNLSPIILFFFLLGISLQAQVERVITLEVNTADIENPNVNDFCGFLGQDPDVSNEDYTIEANVGDVIIWRGVSTSSPEDRVEIRTINHEGSNGGRDIFGSNTIRGEDGEVRATILNTTDEGADYKTHTNFQIKGTEQRYSFHTRRTCRVLS